MRSIAAAVISLAIAVAPAAAQMPGPRGAPDGGAGLASRLERLEQQIADLRAEVAAVETLAKSNAGAGSGYSAAAGSGGASSTEIRQLSEQIADLTQRLERLEAQTSGGAGPRTQAPPPPRRDDYAGTGQETPGYGAAPAPGFEDKQALPPVNGPADRYAPRPPQGAGAVVAPIPAPRGNTQTAATGGSARALFDQAYGALNRREYTQAETYFQQFLDQYPNDALAGSAQYWLGESAFVSGEYKTAADRFLKTFTNYPNNERAPESLLKLAISLRRLGNNPDACATFSELERRYPQAPKSVQQRADAEKKRANCG
jgi:tol-pal system protein YbgF